MTPSILLATLVAASAPAETDCTVTPGNLELFEPTAPGYSRNKVSLHEALETLTRKDGIVVNARAYGCAHVGLTLRWESLKGAAPTTWSALLDRALAELEHTPFRADDHMRKHFIKALTEARRRATPADSLEKPPDFACGEFTTCAVRVEKTGAGTFALVIEYDFAA